MLFNLNFIPATIKALTRFVQVLDQHPRGAVLLILVITVAGAFMGIPHLQPVLA